MGRRGTLGGRRKRDFCIGRQRSSISNVKVPIAHSWPSVEEEILEEKKSGVVRAVGSRRVHTLPPPSSHLQRSTTQQWIRKIHFSRYASRHLSSTDHG